MSDFTVILPLEILHLIVFHLDQHDCIQCMAVCHRWYHLIPTYMTEAWTSIKISSQSWPKFNVRLLHCLNAHAKNAYIANMDTACVLNELSSSKCAITLLDIKSHIYGEYECFAVEDTLYTALQQFSSSLTDLTITSHPFDISPLQLLSQMHALTHFTLLFDDETMEEVVWMMRPGNSSSYADRSNRFTSKIVFLHLNGALNYETRVMPLLQCCPGLKAMILSSSIDGARMPITDTYFRTTLTYCPQLQYIEWSFDDESHSSSPNDSKVQQWKSLASQTGYDTGIRELSIYGEELADIEPTIPSLQQSQLTLKSLELSCLYGFEDLEQLGDLQFTQLQQLSISKIKVTSIDWEYVFGSCHKLEHVSIVSAVREGETIDSIITVLTSFAKLQSLFLDIKFYADFVIEIEDEPEGAGNPFGEPFDDVDDPEDDDDYEFDDESFDEDDVPVTRNHSQMCQNLGDLSTNGQLYSLYLTSICVSGQGLLDICDIRSLKVLEISVKRHHRLCLEAWELEAFAEKLVAVESNIQSLLLSSIIRVTDTVLEHLAEARQLSLLTLHRCPHITDKGVDLFIENGRKVGSIERKIRLRTCPRVSQDRCTN
ncbi:hypothetical protein BJV82DRAFT_591212, partial [Fennellomyces sp. T-0311]